MENDNIFSPVRLEICSGDGSLQRCRLPVYRRRFSRRTDRNFLR